MNLVHSTKCREPILIGCGIFNKEINWLIKKNKWLISTSFLDSNLHTNYDLLEKSLCRELEKYSCTRKFVFYGECHPNMDNILSRFNTFRTEGQNCAEILLGNYLYNKELSLGAFFLFEDFALNWKSTFEKLFGSDRETVKQIFHEDRKYILAVRTRCTNDYANESEKIAEYLELPLKILDVNLDNLESRLITALNQINGNSDE